MLPMLQQRHVEVHRFRETIVTARFALGLAERRRENAPHSLNTNQADFTMRRLAPLHAREHASSSQSLPRDLARAAVKVHTRARRAESIDFALLPDDRSDQPAQHVARASFR